MDYNIFKIPKDEIKLIGESNYIYGHLTNKGLKKISTHITDFMNKYEINYIKGIDLGCGDGELINYFNKNIKNNNWTGIELSETRINLSEYKDDNLLIQGDLLEINYSDYNFIFANNVCYDDELCEKLEDKIYREFRGFFIFSKKIINNNLYRSADLLNDALIETNWEKKHKFYFYKY